MKITNSSLFTLFIYLLITSPCTYSNPITESFALPPATQCTEDMLTYYDTCVLEHGTIVNKTLPAGKKVIHTILNTFTTIYSSTDHETVITSSSSHTNNHVIFNEGVPLLLNSVSTFFEECSNPLLPFYMSPGYNKHQQKTHSNL